MLVARLQHPHILSVHDSGEAAGQLWFTMPFVEGESLRDRLEREGQLPVTDAIQITRDVADALSYAHSHDVVHRDIKPENILLSGDHALVADFGIARAITAAGGERLTETGIAVGTPAYMSPEQASGASRTDGRADVYALGCVVYEMLSGGPPFTAPSPQAVLARHTLDPVPPLRTVRKAVPAGVERAVMRALEKVPADRFATATQFADALVAPEDVAQPARRSRVRMFGISTAVLVVLGMAGWLVTTHRSVAPAERSLAVLPCANTNKDSTTDYLSDGVTEELITRLSRTGAFGKVISLPSVMRYKGTAKPPAQIGAELGVRLLLFCRYGQNGDRDRLALQLVNPGDGAVRWADEYERELRAYQTVLPSQLVGDVVTAVGARLSASQRARLGHEPTHDRLALNLNKEGQFFLNKYTPEALERSIVLFRQALARDSTLADAFVGLGFAYAALGMGHGTLDSREAYPLVRESAERALGLDSLSAGAHALLGIYEWGYGWDWKVSQRELERAVQLDPASAMAYDQLAFTYAALGKFDEAIRAGIRATELDPVTPMYWADAGVQYFASGRYGEALPYVEHALEMDPNGPPYHWILGAIYVEMGRLDKAAAELERTVGLSGGLDYWRGYLGYARGLMGDTAAAHAALRRLDASWRTRSNSTTALAVALVYIGLGDRDAAFHWLDEAYRARSSSLPFVVTTAPGRRLASDPRYAPLLRRLNLRG
jgi:serine/threonine-protein kinase